MSDDCTQVSLRRILSFFLDWSIKPQSLSINTWTNRIHYRFPAETIKVDTSGKRFDRMCSTRKSLLHFVSTSEQTEANAAGGQPADGSDGDTIRRRSRPRRSRGKRRNTIAGTDQKEIAEVVNNG